MKIDINLDKSYKNYTSTKAKNTIFYYNGFLKIEDIKKLFSFIIRSKCKNEVLKIFESWLSKQKEQFSIIIKTNSSILCAVDKVSAFPLFIFVDKQFIKISSESSLWIKSLNKKNLNYKVLKIYKMTGFTLSSDTLHKNIKKLLPGEYLDINKESKPISIKYKRYFLFYPTFSNLRDEKKLVKELDEILSNICKRTIKRADGRTIQVALSSGFDSKVLLGKFLELGYTKVETFTYGTKNNFEAKSAQKIAKKLNVKWEFVDSKCSKNTIKSFYDGDLANYFFLNSGLVTTAAMTEIVALKRLLKKDKNKKNDIFVNGQTGDFITGGHIPNIKNKKKFFLEMFTKHFGLNPLEIKKFGSIKIEKIFYSWCKNNLSGSKLKNLNLNSLAQVFEWQGRQSNFIVQQQRAYDYLNLEWALPFWDSELMDFYLSVPIEYQINQKLYVNFIKTWNYKNIFDELRPSPELWVKNKYLILLCGKLIEFIKNKDEKNNFYSKRKFENSDLNHLYGFFNKKDYLLNFKKVRNPISLFNKHHLSNIKVLN